MNREDFLIENVPTGYEVDNVDLSPTGRPACVVITSFDAGAELRLVLGEDVVPLPQDSVVKWASHPFVLAPIVRWVGDDRVVLVRQRARDGPNAWIVDQEGTVQKAFRVGDGVQDVIANEKWIVITYFDEGIFGGEQIPAEGLAFFDSSGEFRTGYASAFDSSVEVYDCYCATWCGDEELIFYPYAEPNFPLVRLNLAKMTQNFGARPTISTVARPCRPSGTLSTSTPHMTILACRRAAATSSFDGRSAQPSMKSLASTRPGVSAVCRAGDSSLLARTATPYSRFPDDSQTPAP